MGIAGITFLFLPTEILNYTGENPSFFNTIFIQIFGGLYFSFALINWMAKGNLIGGIYSKPLAMGNFSHFFIGSITLIKAAFSMPEMIHLWILGVIYLVFAIPFALVAFGNPLSKKVSSD